MAPIQGSASPDGDCVSMSSSKEGNTAGSAAASPVIEVIAYGPDGFEERAVESAQEARAFLGKWPVVWVNVDRVKDADVIAAVGDVFELHHLALEDVAHVHQRSKLEQYGAVQFIVVRMVTVEGQLRTEQLSLFLGEGFVVTFQEEPGDSFDSVRKRIRKDTGKIRGAGPDYLAYALLDAVVDGYFPALEAYGEKLEDLEEQILANPTRDTLSRIHAVKRELLTLRRAVWPLRDVMSSLIRDPVPLIRDETRIYLRDCYDHSVRILDLLETYRELCSDLMDVYMSSVSNRLNEVMKVLTFITAIFVPPTLVAGIYGMNFNPEASPWNMPELEWYLGYPFALGLMLLLAAALMWFFKVKGWIGGDTD